MARNVSHISAFVPIHLREALEHSAREHDRSLSAELRCAIRTHLLAPSGAARAPLASSTVPEGEGKARA